MTIDNRPDAILKLARQFMESRILLSAAEMNIFTHLDETPSTAQDLAGRLHADLRGLTILLDALAAMGVLSKQEDTYLTATDAAPFLTDKSPQSVLPMIRHAAHLWESWSNLTFKVKGHRLTEPPVSAVRDVDELHAFIGTMHVAGTPLAQKIVAAIRPHEVRNLLHVGGASGTYSILHSR